MMIFHDDVTCCLSKKTYDHDIIIITPQPPLFNFNDWLCFYMNPQQNSAIYIQGNLTEKNLITESIRKYFS